MAKIPDAIVRVIVGLALLGLVLGSIATVLWALVAAWMRSQSRRRIAVSLEDLPAGSRFVVLGCPTRTTSGEPNRYFFARIEAAAAAYHHRIRPHPVPLGRAPDEPAAASRVEIVCSGWDEHGEATEMAEALIAARVARGAISVDGEAARTIDSVEHAAKAYPGQPVVFVSQRFHLPRVLFLARSFGLDAWGLPAEGTLHGLRPRLREGLAQSRAILDRGWRRGP